MSRRESTGTFWPSPRQESLLAVALGGPAEALAAWRSVETHFRLDELERGSFALLPLIYRSLTNAGFEGAVLPQLKGIYRKAWVMNSLLLERAKETADALRVGDVPALFIEGVVLAERFYPELGLRPASSVDVLVEARDVPRALATLASAGWRMRPGSPGTGETHYLSDDAASTLVLRAALAPDFAPHRTLWETAGTLALGEVELLVPTPTDTLLAVCISNARAKGGRVTQWIVDAKMVLAENIDWERVTAVAAAREQSVRLGHACAYLESLPGPRPPQSACIALAATDTSVRERLTYRASAGAGGVWRLPLAAWRRAFARVGRTGRRP